MLTRYDAELGSYTIVGTVVGWSAGPAGSNHETFNEARVACEKFAIEELPKLRTTLVAFHETAPVVNENLQRTSTQASIRILMSRMLLGSMQVEFRVEVRRCHLSRELVAQGHYRSRRDARVSTTRPVRSKLHTILGKGL